MKARSLTLAVVLGLGLALTLLFVLGANTDQVEAAPALETQAQQTFTVTQVYGRGNLVVVALDRSTSINQETRNWQVTRTLEVANTVVPTGEMAVCIFGNGAVCSPFFTDTLKMQTWLNANTVPGNATDYCALCNLLGGASGLFAQRDPYNGAIRTLVFISDGCPSGNCSETQADQRMQQLREQDYVYIISVEANPSGGICPYLQQWSNVVVPYQAPLPPADEISALIPHPELHMNKFSSSYSVRAGQMVTYTLVVTNIGNVTDTYVVKDVLPISVTPSGVITWTTGSLAPGTVWTTTLTTTVDPAHPEGWMPNVFQIISTTWGLWGETVNNVWITPNFYTLTVATAGTGSGVVTPSVGIHNYNYNTVVNLEVAANTGSTFAGWSGDPDCADGSVTMNTNLSCTATFRQLRPADISTSGIFAIDVITQPGTITVTIRISNTGQLTGTVIMTAPIPSGATYVPNSVQGAYWNPKWGWIEWLGQIPGGTAKIITFTIAGDLQSDVYTHRAYLSLDGAFDRVLITKTHVRPPTPADLSTSTKMASKTVVYYPGEAIVYTITLHNIGGKTASNVVMTDAEPLGTWLAIDSITGGWWNSDYDVVEWIGSIPASGTITVTFVVTVPIIEPATITNRVQLWLDGNRLPDLTASTLVRYPPPPPKFYMYLPLISKR
ncbi:hypothetical protein MUP32_00265 [Candidatus Microgenomates bacterium]|nr:hypothetical protein [Candidatus Microgenomates bacterium]